MKMKIKIYLTSYCTYCHLAKEFFDKHKIEYEEVNVAEDDSAFEEMKKKSHQIGVPVIEIDNEVFVGFNRSEISRVLGLNH